MLDDDDDRELPVAVLRPHRLRGQATAARGDLGRWANAHARALRGQRFAFILAGVGFCSIMLVMGYVSDRRMYTEAHERSLRLAATPRAQHDCTHGATDPWAARVSGPDEATAPPDGIDHLGGVLRTLTVTPR
jgi:hypothetical protein